MLCNVTQNLAADHRRSTGTLHTTKFTAARDKKRKSERASRPNPNSINGEIIRQKMCTFRFPGYYYCLPIPIFPSPPKKGLNTPEQQSQESTSSSKQFRIVARKNKNQPRIVIKKTRTVPQAEAVAQKRIRQCSRRYSTRPKSKKAISSAKARWRLFLRQKKSSSGRE